MVTTGMALGNTKDKKQTVYCVLYADMNDAMGIHQIKSIDVYSLDELYAVCRENNTISFYPKEQEEPNKEMESAYLPKAEQRRLSKPFEKETKKTIVKHYKFFITECPHCSLDTELCQREKDILGDHICINCNQKFDIREFIVGKDGK